MTAENTVKLSPEEKTQRINAALEAFGFPTFDTLNLDEKQNAEMLAGLAQAYAIPGFRKWIMFQLKRVYIAGVERTVTSEDPIFGKARALTLKELLRDGKRSFEEYQKLEAARRRVGFEGQVAEAEVARRDSNNASVEALDH